MHVCSATKNGLEKCVACFLCAAACPSNCIYIEAAENIETNRVSGAERYAKEYIIDYNRCIFCGIAWRLALRTRSRMGMALSWLRSTRPA